MMIGMRVIDEKLMLLVEVDVIVFVSERYDGFKQRKDEGSSTADEDFVESVLALCPLL